MFLCLLFSNLVFSYTFAVRASWHYWGNASYYSFWDVFYTAHCQAVIAIFWGVLGLCAILYGQKIRSRDLWRAGAVLLAADILKLLFVDLRGAATLVRIRSTDLTCGVNFIRFLYARTPLIHSSTRLGREKFTFSGMSSNSVGQTQSRFICVKL